MKLGSVREAQRRLTRQRLVDAARQVFASDGYGQAAIGNIAAAAEVNRATFYLHFQNKAEVFIAMVDQFWTEERLEFWRSLDPALTAGTPTAIRAWLKTAVDWYEAQAPLVLAWHEALVVDDDAVKAWKAQMDMRTEALPNFLARFDPKDRVRAQTAILFLIIQLDLLCLRAVVQKVMKLNRREMLDMLANMWVRALPQPGNI